MFIFPGRKILALALSVTLAFSVVFSSAPFLAQADTADVIIDVANQLQGVYYWLGEDPPGKDKVANAKDGLKDLTKEEIINLLWPPNDSTHLSLSKIISSKKYQDEATAKDEIGELLYDATKLTYQTDLTGVLESFYDISENRETVETLLPGVSLVQLYGFFNLAQTEGVKNSIPQENWKDILKSKDYSNIRGILEQWLSKALSYAASSEYSDIYAKLQDIGWTVNDLAQAENAIARRVDPQYQAEIALLKAYVRSKAHFSGTASSPGSKEKINITAGNSISGKILVLENDVTGELEYNSNNPNVTVKENNGTITISAASGSGGQTAEITAYYENKDADWVYKGIVNISTPSTGGPGAGPTPTVITLPTDPEKANQEVQKNLSDLVQQAASDPAKAAEQVASLVQAIVQAKVELAAGTKEQFVNTVTTVLQATGQLPEKAVQETGKGNYAVNEQAALAQVEQLVKVAQNLQQAVENLNKATGAGIQAPPPPVLTVRAKELGAEGKAQVTIPAAATAKLAEAIPEAAVRVSTPAGALVLPAAETTKATGGKGTLGVGFKETAVSGVSLPGGRLVSKVVDVTVTASSDAVTRTIASFTRPIQLFVPYNKGQVLNPDALGVYKLLEGGRVKFVGGKVLPDGTVGAQLKSLSAYTVLEYSKTFADLAGHWAKKDVEIMASRHVARGISETQFAPDADVTRAQFAALLIRTLGIDEAAPTGTVFSDVPKGAWYAGAVETAYAHQLVSGMGGGLFAPDEKITREQMAVMITRALKAAGKPATLTQAQITEVLKAYADRAEVSPWATQAMAEAVSTGIVKGRTATTLVPQGTATRAEAVVMLKRLIDAAGIY